MRLDRLAPLVIGALLAVLVVAGAAHLIGEFFAALETAFQAAPRG